MYGQVTLVEKVVLSIILYILIPSEQILALSRNPRSYSTSLRKALLSCLDLIVGRQRAIKQPAFVNFCNISDEGLIPSLKYLMEDNPIGLPVLP